MTDNTIRTKPTAETPLLDLLRMGARIEFDSGRTLQGSPSDGYIQMSNEAGSLGLWDMDSETGVRDAVDDLERDAAESGLTLHGESLPHPDVETTTDEG